MHSNYSILFTTGYFGDVVDPSNNVSAWVENVPALRRTVKIPVTTEQARDSVFARVPMTEEARDGDGCSGVGSMEFARVFSVKQVRGRRKLEEVV